MGLRKTTAITTVLGLLVGAGAAAGTAAALWPDDPAPPPVPGMVEGDLAIRAAPGQSGPVQISVLTLRCGMSFITGTHAEYFSEHGQICRIGVEVRNNQTTSINVDSTRQLLVLPDGSTAAPDNITMLIRRQIALQPVGAHNAAVLEYWYDITAGISPTAIRLQGTADLPQIEVPLPPHNWKP